MSNYLKFRGRFTCGLTCSGIGYYSEKIHNSLTRGELKEGDWITNEDIGNDSLDVFFSICHNGTVEQWTDDGWKSVTFS